MLLAFVGRVYPITFAGGVGAFYSLVKIFFLITSAFFMLDLSVDDLD